MMIEERVVVLDEQDVAAVGLMGKGGSAPSQLRQGRWALRVAWLLRRAPPVKRQSSGAFRSI
jgi:hypothetical protein